MQTSKVVYSTCIMHGAYPILFLMKAIPTRACRVGQNRVRILYMTAHIIISLLKLCICTVRSTDRIG